ncbi:MAG TPA: hypothetical protein VEU50_40255, partial [Archangium sp.]|nr:hypothetical protein [Archangium sp.]
YSALAFSPTITASANGSSASATLSVTAQPRPGSIDSDSSQRFGNSCGGKFPSSAGDHGVLYSCQTGADFGTVGKCTFLQECPLGCESEPSENFKYSDHCATSGPFPISLNPSYIIGGAPSQGTLLLGAAAPAGSKAMVRAKSTTATAFPTGYAPIATGATTSGFKVATSILPAVEFVGLGVNFEIPTPCCEGSIFMKDRTALTWLVVTPPPENPPAQPQPVLGFFTVDPDQVSGNGSAYATLWLSGMSQASGPTISVTSSHPQIAPVPSSVTIPDGSNVQSFWIATANPPATTHVTFTATDGVRTVTETLAVAPSTCVPTTCAAQGKTCGSVSNGCGGWLDCGVCSGGQVCTFQNVCCTPLTCASAGKNCGSIADGCGNYPDCGTCTAPETCGGGGVNNVCGSPGTAALTLTVGGRSGTAVTSTPAGLNVSSGSTGSAQFTVGTSITLKASDGREAIWSGACSSAGAKRNTCTFTLAGSAAVTANIQ